MSEVGEIQRGFVISGRVQGVGFRWWTRRTAEELGLRGTVRNRRDGTVEVHAAGTAGSVEKLGEWLHEGPRGARVREVEMVESDASLPGGFEIVR